MTTSDSHINLKLEEYVKSRGIEMPFYTNGSKIIEEAEELREALIAYLALPEDAGEEVRAILLKMLMEEVADVTFTAAVAARQCGFTVEEALEVKISKDRGRGEKIVPQEEKS